MKAHIDALALRFSGIVFYVIPKAYGAAIALVLVQLLGAK
jgi:hypothetical protein